MKAIQIDARIVLLTILFIIFAFGFYLITFQPNLHKIINQVPAQAQTFTYKDPTDTFSLQYPSVFIGKEYPYANSRSFGLTDGDNVIQIFLVDQTGTQEIKKTAYTLAKESLATESLAPAFNDNVTKLEQTDRFKLKAYQYQTTKGSQVTQNFFIDLGKIVDLNQGKSRTLQIIAKSRSDSALKQIDQILSSLVINK